MFQYAKSLWFDHSFKMNPPIKWAIFEFVVPQWAPGLSIPYTPLLAILSHTFFHNDTSIRQIPSPTLPNYEQTLLHDPAYVYCSVLNPAITALTTTILYLLCVELGLPKKRAVAIALTFGLISPAAVYSKLDFAQPLFSLFVIAGFLLLLKASKEQGVLCLMLSGVSFGLAILSRSEFMIFTPILVFAVCFMPPWKAVLNPYGLAERVKKVFAFILPLCVMVVINQAITFLKFGTWLNTGYPIASLLVFRLSHWTTAFAGNLISPGRGILVFFPISLLSVVGIRRFIAINSWFAATTVTFLFATLAFYPFWRTWDAGMSWGPRYLIPIVPYLCLLGYLALPPKLGPNYKVLMGILLAVCAIDTLQGLLFDFLHFYASLQLSSDQLDQQYYHFSIFASPLFVGWRDLLHPESFDIKWLQPGTGGFKLIFPLFGLLSLLILGKVWLNFFRSPQTDLERTFELSGNLLHK